MSKANRKATTKAATKPLASSPDAALIRTCVQYAHAVAAAAAGFKADPDGNCIYAAPAADKSYRAASKTLALIGAAKATTAAGISAKARIVPMVLRNDDCCEVTKDGAFFGNIDAVSARFYGSFAADVKSYMDTVVEAEWAAAHKKGGAA